MKIPIYQVDAFAKERFKGNPAAICLLEEWLDDEVMQKIAAENNLAETAFVIKENEQYYIRWFTPEREIDLCGHATLATAYIILVHLGFESNKVEFFSQSGLLEVHRKDEKLSMIFPSRAGKISEAPDCLSEALGVEPELILKSRDYMLVYKNEEIIRDIKPDMSLLKKVDSLGIIITAPGENVDFVSRFFAPGCGIAEDPVTGSAHCTLVPYWSNRLGKKELLAKQLSSRGGSLYCRDMDDRVEISGNAVLYLEGSIEI